MRGRRRRSQVASRSASPSLRSSSSGTGSSIQRKELSRLKPDVFLEQRPPPHPASLDRRCRLPRRFRVCERTLRAGVGRVPSRRRACCSETCLRRSGKSSSSSSRRWTRSSFLKNSPKSAAAASRAEAAPSAAARGAAQRRTDRAVRLVALGGFSETTSETNATTRAATSRGVPGQSSQERPTQQ
jgi:hypothetical protein